MDSRHTNDSRRRFVAATTGAAMLLGSGLGLAGCGGGGSDTEKAQQERFGFGVASGDPLSDRVILWTRVNLPTDQPVAVGWEVATDGLFSNLVQSGTAVTTASQDYTVKVDVTGLLPASTYFYRFRHGDQVSAIGRTRTLPVGDVRQVRMAVFSCAAFPLGQFHAYADAARRGDFDVALHLGDYIYETGLSDAEQIAATLLGRKMDPKGELHTLAEYRARHAQYRTDSSLRAVHATMPVIAVWDDHDIVNDTWRDGAGGHDPATEGSFAVRRAAAIQAWHEWLPTRTTTLPNLMTTYRSFDFGNLLSLHMLDTRVVGRDAPVSRDQYLAGVAATATRQLLGSPQSDWLTSRMQASTATWQVLGQQVLMARMEIPLSVYDNFTEDSINEFLVAQDTPASARTQRQIALVAQQRIGLDLGNWNGFQAARDQVLSIARSQNKNLIVLSGDSHNAWASNLTDSSGQAVGVEYGVPSVTSNGLEISQRNVGRQFMADSLPRLMPDVKYAETSHRGYMVVTLTPTVASATWVFVSSVLDNSFVVNAGPVWATVPGAGNRRLIPG